MKLKHLNIVLLLFCTLASAQTKNRSNDKTLLWPFHIPASMQNGPVDFMVHGTYYFTREKFGGEQYANLHLTITRIDFFGNGIPAFKYRGKVYNANEMNAADGLGTNGYDQLKITSISLKLQIDAAQANIGGSANWINSMAIVGQSSVDGVHEIKITKDHDLDKIDINLVASYVTNIYWQDQDKLVARIENLAKTEKNKSQYKDFISQADNAFYKNNLQEAKLLYGKALNLFPNETYPKTQLDKIEKKLGEQQLKEKQKAEQEIANKTSQNSQQANQSSTNNLNNSSTQKITSTQNTGTTQKSGTIQNTSTTQNQTSHNSGELSEKVRVNGEFVQVFKKNGIPYMKRADGSINQTTEVAYSKISQASNEQQKRAEINKQNEIDAQKQMQKSATESMNQRMNEIKANQEAAKKFETELVGKVSQLSQSFTLGNQASNSLKAARDTSLDKLYNSIEELNADFDQQMQIIRQETQSFSATNTAAMSSYIDATGNYGTSYDGAINSSMKAVAGIFNDIKANKIRKEEEARLEAQRQAQLNAIELRRKEALFGLRKKMFENFPEGKLPLESSNVKQSEVYVFAYIGSKETLLIQEKGSLSISNDFVVRKLDDGSFPYKSEIANNLKKFGSGKVTIVGYFLDQNQAKEMQSMFLNLANKSGLQVNTFTYNQPIKKTTGTSTNDFWETGNKTVQKQEEQAQVQTQEPEPKKTIKKSNFWND